jgi:hypothetical protein
MNQIVHDFEEKTGKRPDTRYCQFASGYCSPVLSLTIDDAYVRNNTPIVREQLTKAGIRLAHMLDQTVGNIK